MADLLLRPVEEEWQRERRAMAIDRLLARRPARRCVTEEQTREARDAGRP